MKQGRHDVEVRALQAASGSRGSVDVAPSVDSSFSSSPPFFSSSGARWPGWDETPRRLGLGAHGGTVAAYL
jgi:hypothetical protein